MYGLERRIERLIKEVKSLLNETDIQVDSIEMRKGKITFPCDITSISDGFSEYSNGEVWSGKNFDDYALFKFKINIPELKEGQEYYLHITTNKSGGHNMVRPQMLLFEGNKAIQGLDTNHESVRVSELAGKGEKWIYIYAFSGLPKKTPYGSEIDMDVSTGVRLYVNLQIRRKELVDFYYNLQTPYSYLQFIEKNSYEYQKILNDINESLSLVDFRIPHTEEFYQSILKANEYIIDNLYGEDKTIKGNVTLVGHTHIDVAWLWQYHHTVDKAVRSFATEVKLLKEYDEHRFMSSQAQLYEFVKRENPELYQNIKQLVKEGRWEVEGSMWVEPDMNLISGESIVLQILYGKKFFKEEFDVNCEVLWLPDVFGYSAALPQILMKSGIKYFMTSKLAWNERNRFPYDTFEWKGIDGSKVLAHCTSYLPNGYNPDIENGEILVGWNNYLQKDINDDILIPFGFADGGGGVTDAQIEEIKRVSCGFPGVPKAKIGTAGEYFHKLEDKVSGNKHLRVWAGELYYEKHRGTYTSMSRVKKQNRKCEFLYSNVQWLWMLAKCFENIEFPKERFEIGLKNILINQFHDVLPGTSISEVYEDSDALYNESFAIGDELSKTALQTLKMGDTDNEITVFNPFSQNVSGYIKYDGKYRYVDNVPAKGYGTYSINFKNNEIPVTISENVIENQFYIIKISDNGEIESLFDKRANRHCFISGKAANHFRVFEDKPGFDLGYYNLDNWDLECFYAEREFDIPKPSRISVLEEDGEYAIIRTERNYMDSHIVQDMIVYARSPRIDFKTNIDWKEHSQVLKVEFPIDVNTTRATYEIQFGYIERPTISNTTWDETKFEVCAHKWADISDSGYGLSVMNDCKYGYSAKDSTLSLTLLRCGNCPNPLADKEHHQFTYSILPHMGDIRDADVVREAYILNNPLFVAGGSIMNDEFPKHFSLFECKGAVLETIKPAENGDGIVLRFYEPYNSMQTVNLKSGKKIKRVEAVDLLENPVSKTDIKNCEDGISFKIKPFEIITLKVWLE